MEKTVDKEDIEMENRQIKSTAYDLKVHFVNQWINSNQRRAEILKQDGNTEHLEWIGRSCDVLQEYLFLLEKKNEKSAKLK